MIKVLETNSTNKDFKTLVSALDKELAIRDGEDHAFYNQFNGLEDIHHCLVAYNSHDEPLGCGAFKAHGSNETEIKRMYVKPTARGKGIALKILNSLEIWSKTLGYKQCILETGTQQPEAIALYKKAGYRIIDNYGQYKDAANSICFAKTLE